MLNIIDEYTRECLSITPSKSMEYFLSAPHWLDAMTPPLERHLQQLGDAIQFCSRREQIKRELRKIHLPNQAHLYQILPWIQHY